MLSTEIIDFGKQMDSAKDKQTLVDLAEGATRVLDLGAGTGAISKAIAEKWHCHVDAVDLNFKERVRKSTYITYHRTSILHYLDLCIQDIEEDKPFQKYDCVVLSAILHELNDWNIHCMLKGLARVCTTNCRFLIREPFFDKELGPIPDYDKRSEFLSIISQHISCGKYKDYMDTIKKDSNISLTDYRNRVGCTRDTEPDPLYIDWVNLAFACAYGEDSWEREKTEKRYARSLSWLREQFNGWRTFTGFQIFSVKDESYRDLFEKAGFKEAFDLLDYTGMIIVIDYSKKED